MPQEILEMVKLIFHQFENALASHTHTIERLSEAVERVAKVVSEDHKRCDKNHKKTHDMFWKSAVFATAYMIVGGVIVGFAYYYLRSKGVAP